MRFQSGVHDCGTWPIANFFRDSPLVLGFSMYRLKHVHDGMLFTFTSLSWPHLRCHAGLLNRCTLHLQGLRVQVSEIDEQTYTSALSVACLQRRRHNLTEAVEQLAVREESARMYICLACRNSTS